MNESYELHHVKGKKRRKLITFLGISGILSVCIFVIEWIGSKQSGSLALFADAGHIATDVFAHVISILAIFIAAKKPTKNFPFGYHRIEVLAALANSFLLVGIAVFILWQSYERILVSSPIHVESMLTYSLIGLFINIVSAGLLFRVSKVSINLRSTYLHVLSDLLSTIAVIIGALIIQWTNFLMIDSILSILIGMFILRTSYSIIRESLEILLEAFPHEFDSIHFLEHLKGFSGVKEISGFKVRKLTSGIYTLEIQIVVDGKADRDDITLEIHKLGKSHFGIPYVFVELISDSLLLELNRIPIIEKENHQSHHGHHHH